MRGILKVLLVLTACCITLSSAFAADNSAGVEVKGPGVPPTLGLACCEHDLAEMHTILANPDTLKDLKDLHAEIAIAIPDFSDDRAAIVHRLNHEGIPAIAWLMLPEKDGAYMNADNEPQAAARVHAFEQWTIDQKLQWAAVGLDIEPNFNELAALKTHRWRLITTLLSRAANGKRIENAQQSYSALIRTTQSHGYRVQTYQMPYVPAEQSARSTLLDKMLGTVEVQGNDNYLMLYTSFVRPIGAGMLWSLGRDAQDIAIGSTDGAGAAGLGAGPLNWEEFSRDLIVASHYSRNIGVYDLEGCARQGFLPKLRSFDWGQAVVIPSASVTRAKRMGAAMRTALWIGSHIVYFFIAGLLLLAWIVVRWKQSRKRTLLQPGPAAH